MSMYSTKATEENEGVVDDTKAIRMPSIGATNMEGDTNPDPPISAHPRTTVCDYALLPSSPCRTQPTMANPHHSPTSVVSWVPSNTTITPNNVMDPVPSQKMAGTRTDDIDEQFAAQEEAARQEKEALLKAMEGAQRREQEIHWKRVARRKQRRRKQRLLQGTKNKLRKELSAVDAEMGRAAKDIFDHVAKIQHQRDVINACLEKKRDICDLYKDRGLSAEDLKEFDMDGIVPQAEAAMDWELPMIPSSFATTVKHGERDSPFTEKNESQPLSAQLIQPKPAKEDAGVNVENNFMSRTNDEGSSDDETSKQAPEVEFSQLWSSMREGKAASRQKDERDPAEARETKSIMVAEGFGKANTEFEANNDQDLKKADEDADAYSDGFIAEAAKAGAPLACLLVVTHNAESSNSLLPEEEDDAGPPTFAQNDNEVQGIRNDKEETVEDLATSDGIPFDTSDTESSSRYDDDYSCSYSGSSSSTSTSTSRSTSSTSTSTSGRGMKHGKPMHTLWKGITQNFSRQASSDTKNAVPGPTLR